MDPTLKRNREVKLWEASFRKVPKYFHATKSKRTRRDTKDGKISFVMKTKKDKILRTNLNKKCTGTSF